MPPRNMEDNFITNEEACCDTPYIHITLEDQNRHRQQQHQQQQQQQELAAVVALDVAAAILEEERSESSNSSSGYNSPALLTTDEDLAMEIQGLELLLENLGSSTDDDDSDEGGSYANDSLDMNVKRGISRNPRDQRESRLLQQAARTTTTTTAMNRSSSSLMMEEGVIKPLELPVNFTPLPMDINGNESSSRQYIRRYSNCAA